MGIRPDESVSYSFHWCGKRPTPMDEAMGALFKPDPLFEMLLHRLGYSTRCAPNPKDDCAEP